jgi:hypothetical protein
VRGPDIHKFQDPLHALALELFDAETDGLTRIPSKHLRPACEGGLWASSALAPPPSVDMCCSAVKVAMAGMRRGPRPVLRGTRKPLVLGEPGKGPIMSRQAIQVRNSLSAPTPGKRHSTFVQPTTQRLQDGRVAVQVEEAFAVTLYHGRYGQDAPSRIELARVGRPPLLRGLLADRVIQHVLDAHNGAVGSRDVVTRHPDRDNRGSHEIDAYAESPGLPALAIEHTEIESLQYHDRDSAWFMQGPGALEAELDGSFPFWLGVEVPYRNVVPSQDWDAIRSAIRTWLFAHASNLPDGRTTHVLAGVPSPLVVLRDARRLDAKVVLMRQVPSGDREELLLARMHDRLDHKYVRLGEYRRAGARAVTVLESDDIALVNEQMLYRAFLRAMRERPRPDLDQVWLATSYLAECPVYCFLVPD